MKKILWAILFGSLCLPAAYGEVDLSELKGYQIIHSAMSLVTGAILGWIQAGHLKDANMGAASSLTMPMP